jgi:hypothetical protein
MCCVVEFEDVIISSVNAKMIYSGSEIKTPGILFIAAISIYEMDKALRSINTAKFSTIYAYLFDAFAADDNKPQWRKNISTHYRTIKKITRLFVPFRRSVDDFANLYQIPVSYIPLGVDAINHGGYDEHKIIDVNGYGRQYGPLEKILSQRFNDRDSGRIFHHTNHKHVAFIHDFYEHRRLFWQQLRKSKIALAFDPLFTGEKRFRFSFVGQRWFESAAAGCVIVGKRPNCPEMDELFDWPDATIELPDNTNEMTDFIKYMLNNYDLESIGHRNYEECLSRHDWRLRIGDILTECEI